MLTNDFGDSSFWFGANSTSYLYNTTAPSQHGDATLLAGSLSSSMPSTPSSYLNTLHKAAGLDLSTSFSSPFPSFVNSAESTDSTYLPFDITAPPSSTFAPPSSIPSYLPGSSSSSSSSSAAANEGHSRSEAQNLPFLPPSSPPSFFNFGTMYSTPLPAATSSHSASSLSNRLAHYHPSPGIFDPPELFPPAYPFSFGLGSPVPNSVPASPSLLSAPAAASSSPARLPLHSHEEQTTRTTPANPAESAAGDMLYLLMGGAKHDRSAQAGHIGASSPPIASASSSSSSSILSASSNPRKLQRSAPAKRPKRPRPFDSLAVMNRDHFQTIAARLGTSEFDGYRIYPDPDIGYSGNARIFKPYPEDNERALVLTCRLTVLEDDEELVKQCSDCIAYYEMKKYFRASPTAKGRALHVRNSKIIKVENGELLISARVMCSSAHHRGQPFNLTFGLVDHRTQKTLLSGQIAVVAKQWKRSREPVADLGFDFSKVEVRRQTL